MSLVRNYINSFDEDWDVKAVGEWRGDPVVWMCRFDPETAQYRHHISRYDGRVQVEEEWANSEERARMAFDAMCGR